MRSRAAAVDLETGNVADTSAIAGHPSHDKGLVEISAWARWPVVAIAAAVTAILVLTSGRLGYFGDELYFLAAGRHLDWSYADQPPLVPLLARLMDTLFPDSVTALRMPATLAVALSIVVVSLIARELGGGRRAQVLAAAGYAVSWGVLWTAFTLSTAVIDSFNWTLLTWLLVRWVRTRQDRLLLMAGLVTAVSMQVKDLVAVFWIILIVAVLAVGPREMLRRPMLWVGGAVTVVTSVPNLWWQIDHGFPQMTMTQVVSAEQDMGGGRLTFLPIALLTAGLPIGMVLLCYGMVRLVRSADLAPYRFLGWTAAGVFVAFWVTNGRWNYVVGLFGLLMSAAVVELERRPPARWWRWLRSWPCYAVAALVPVVILQLVGSQGASWTRDSLGTTAAVAQAYHQVPPAQRRNAVIVGDTYAQASVLDQFGPAYGLPEVYSPNRGYWYFGPPPDNAGPTVFIGLDDRSISRYFGSVRKVGAVNMPGGLRGINLGVSIWICTDQKVPWSKIWPTIRDFNIVDRTIPFPKYRPVSESP
jgi:4-amino-4-deoxy-L-arabinose transferase-like glycosyltransferase